MQLPDDTLRPIVILNVDDYDAGRYVRSRLLRDAGYEVHDAGTGAEALRLAEAFTPDLIVLDVHLPDMSGLDVCQQVKRSPQLEGTVVLQVSASAVSGEQQVLGLDTGADSYLVEPLEPNVLLATVRSLLRLRKAEEDLREANRALNEINQELALFNAKLKESNADLRRFSHLASHDLQEPLRAIASYSQLLSNRCGDQLNEQAKHYLGYITDGAERMKMLIDDLLNYAEVSQGAPPEMESFALIDAIRGAMVNLEHTIEETAPQFHFYELPDVRANFSQITQLFQNLLSNAMKYRDPARPLEVSISSTRADGEWLISLADNGLGIDARYLDEIFAPFKRLHGREIPGTGIGLASCRRIIERHGGRIWAESNGEGYGSTIRLLIPA